MKKQYSLKLNQRKKSKPKEPDTETSKKDLSKVENEIWTGVIMKI